MELMWIYETHSSWKAEVYRKGDKMLGSDILIDRMVQITEGEPIRYIKTVERHMEHGRKTEGSGPLMF